MRNKKWGRMLALAMAATVTATGVPVSVHAEESEGVENASADTSDNSVSSDGYHLVWEDEFDGNSLNTDDWNVETHEPGWVNAELQRYTKLDEGNIEVKDGILHILPKYTPAQETSQGGAQESQGGEESNTVAEVTPQHITTDIDFSEKEAGVENAMVQVNFGVIGDVDEAAGKAAAEVVLSNLSLFDVTDNVAVVGNEAVSDGQAPKEWYFNVGGDASATMDNSDGQYRIKIENSGSANWNIQLICSGINLVAGHKYVFSMDATSNVDRATEISVLDSGYAWYGGGKYVISGSSEATPESGQASTKETYTSARLTTQGKHDFTYGRFEAKAKVPTGKGFLPAFWLMASDEQFYGQWPKCGEIDIMEVMGQETNKSYHTIHYGYDSSTGHKENQGNKVLKDSSFADEYHVFRADWEPGKISWYVDDELVYETQDWYTGTDDANQVTYPAPFDQDFYIILNLAIGGSWVGYPDAAAKENINSQEYAIDYVRVYQKDESEYAEMEQNAKRPEKTIEYRNPDSEGNYVLNGNFAKAVPVEGTDATAEKDNWVLHLESDASGSTAVVNDNAVTINPTSVCSQTHSVQLKQTGIPMYKGWEYELSFDAVSTEDRNIVVDVEGPDHGWTRYMDDTSVAVGTEAAHYSYKFTMNKNTDANGSLEFNLGKQNSKAPVTIKNVKLTHVSGEEVKDEGTKEIRPDGNYVYNGSFDQGEKRLGYWEFDEEDASKISVTNDKKKRELMVKVEVPEGASEANPVTISQSELAPLVKGQYEFTFNAYHNGGAADGLTVKIVGDEFTPALTGEKTSFSRVITLDKNLSREESNIEFEFTKPGTYYLDDVFLSEKALLKNGSFDAGLAGYSPYIYDTVKANYVIDNMKDNDNKFAITIEDTVADTADNDWYVQLNQDGLTMEQGKYYYVAFRAKSSIERKIKYCLQQFEGAWTNYSGTGAVEIGNEWKKFSHAFQMENATDTNTRFNITMGSVEGERITQQHDVYIDDIQLVEITKEQFDKINSGELEDPTASQGEVPAPQPGETPSTQPGETPAEGNKEEPTPAPAEGSKEEPTPAPAEGNKEEPAQTPTEGNTENPAQTPSTSDRPATTPSTDRPASTPSETPGTTQTETPATVPSDNTVATTPTQTPAVTPGQNTTPSQQTEDNTIRPDANSDVQTPQVVEQKETEAPAVDSANSNASEQDQSKINNNGKAEKGEVRVTKNSVYTIIGKKIASYMAKADSDKKSFTVPTSVVVDGTKVKITKLAKNAFKDNTNVKSITLGKNITTISKGAFSGCTRLKKITVKGNKLKKVYKSAFKNCKLDKDFKVVIHAKDDESFNKVVDLFRKAGLKDATFIRK